MTGIRLPPSAAHFTESSPYKQISRVKLEDEPAGIELGVLLSHSLQC